MVMRQLNRDDKETGKLIEDSVDRAKEAVQLDIKDGTSWCEFTYNVHSYTRQKSTNNNLWY